MAVAETDIPGIPNEFFAYSKINSPSSKGALNADGTERGFSYLKSENERILTRYQKVNGHDRYFDTEAKILEDIAARTNEATTGSIVLYTELKPCDSCTAIILEFREIRPNITLIVVYR